MLLGARECCGGQWAAVPCFLCMPGAGRVQMELWLLSAFPAQAPGRTRRRVPEHVAPSWCCPALAHELWLRLQGWLGGQAISLTSVTRSQRRVCCRADRGHLYLPLSLLTLHLCGFF